MIYRYIFLYAGAGALLALGASAAPKQSTVSQVDSAHVRVDTCTKTRMIPVTGLVGQPTTFTFPDNEKVELIIQSKDHSWALPGETDNTPQPAQAGEAAVTNNQQTSHQVQLGSNLPLYPVDAGKSSVLTVVTTTADHVQRVCNFKLTAAPDPTGLPDEPGTIFNEVIQRTAVDRHVNGIEPVAATASAAEPAAERPVPRSRKSRLAAKREEEKEEAKQRLRTDAFNAAVGCHYHAKGPYSDINPMCPMDNRMWTLIRFPGQLIPTVYILTGSAVCDGEPEHERRPNQHLAGDLVVVEETARTFCVRMAPNVLQIVNDAYAPLSVQLGQTIAPTSVKRGIIKEKKAPRQ
jgi:hypothetical protein